MEQSIIFEELHDEQPQLPEELQLAEELQLPEESISQPVAEAITITFADEIKSMIQILPKSQMRELMSRLDKRSIRADDTENVRPIAERLLAAYSRKKERSKTAYASTKTVQSIDKPIAEPSVAIEPEKEPERLDNIMIPKPVLIRQKCPVKQPPVVAKKVVGKPIDLQAPLPKQSVTLKSLLN